MRRSISLSIVSIAIIILLAACGQKNPNPDLTNLPTGMPVVSTNTPVPQPTTTATPTLTPTITSTPTPAATATPVAYGPSDFPQNVDPLTGLVVSNTALLNRRPVAVKVNIVPRTSNRPPWGLSFADIVYDYYHNAGYSRFHAIFLGNDASLVGPIRSGRLLDYELVHMYQSIFAYGSADALINQRLLNSDFSDRVLIEGSESSCPPSGSPPFCRFGPATYDILLSDTAKLSAYITKEGVSNSRQKLDGMSFNSTFPAGGVKGSQLFVRYSGDNYTRWDYDPLTGRYLRFQDKVFDTGQGEEYEPLIDRINNQQNSAANVVVILARHEFYQQPPAEIIEILLSGTGTAYAFRDGQMYKVEWNRPTTNSVLFLTNEDGTPFPFKPGNTWFQVVGESTLANKQSEGVYRFNFLMP
jgi:Protein of unknown function (DUF3048) C-terminal domain/Protein of unknown function (DUF3048) N-terminal domain